MSEKKYTDREIMAKGEAVILNEKLAFIAIGGLFIFIGAGFLIFVLSSHQKYDLLGLVSFTVFFSLLGVTFLIFPFLRKPKDPYTVGMKALFHENVVIVKTRGSFKVFSDNDHLEKDIDDEDEDEDDDKPINSFNDDEHNWDDEMTDLEYFDSVDDD